MPDYQLSLTTSALIHSGAGEIVGLVASGSNPAAAGEVVFYDHTSAGGSVVFHLRVSQAAATAIFFPANCRPLFARGCYAEVRDAVVNLWVRGV